MAMPGKSARFIIVDGVGYRWRVRSKPSRRRDDGRTPLRFTVERAGEPGSVLVVTLPCARPDNWRGERTITIRPALVGACVRRAVERGWRAGHPGPAFPFDVAEDDLATLLGEPPQYLVPFLWGMIPEGGDIRDLPRCTQIRSRDDL